MTTTNKKHVLDILKRCFPKADSVKIVQDTLEDGDLHFTSNINRFTVEYEQDGKCQQKHVVIKVPISGDTYAFFESFNCFSREVSLYEVVLPKMAKYLDKSLAPAHLHTTESKTLVLEDVTALGYESGEKLPLLNFNQTKGVLKALALFHAASHKLHEEDPHFLENLLFSHIAGIEFRKNIINSWEPVVLELLRRKNETSLVPRVKAAIDFLKRDDDEIRALINQTKFKFVVLNHGDSRKDNLLLKHGSNNQVEGVQFIDFQTSLWSSPLLDIFYFFATSVSIDVIEAHYDDLIDGYLYELNEKLKKLDCSSSYERADLDKDFKHLRFFLLASVLCLCCVINPMDHAQKKETFSQSEVDVDRLYDLCLNDDTFVHAVYGWLKYCDKCNVFEGYTE